MTVVCFDVTICNRKGEKIDKKNFQNLKKGGKRPVFAEKRLEKRGSRRVRCFLFFEPLNLPKMALCAYFRGFCELVLHFGSRKTGAVAPEKKERHIDRVYRGYEKLRFVIKFGKNADEPEFLSI